MHIPPPKSRKSQHGALMAAALLLMLVSGMFLSAWITLMSSRSAQVSYMDLAVQRRLSVENSRQFAWQCALEKGFDPGSTLQSAQSGTLGANFGGVDTADGWSAMNIFTSTRTPGAMTSVFPYNYTGLRPMSAYLTTENLNRPAALDTVDDYKAYLFMKTYPPMLAGDLFTYYRKPTGAAYASVQIEVVNSASSTALWVVNGRTVVRDNASFFARTTPSPLQLPFYTRSLYVQSHDSVNARAILGTTTDGSGSTVKLLPSNLAAAPTTTGPVSADPNDRFKGHLNVIKNDFNPDNSLWHFMDRENAALRSGFTLLDVFSKSTTSADPFWMEDYAGTADDMPPQPPFDYKNDYIRTLFIRLDHVNLPHLRITNPVDQIVFYGQTTGADFIAAGRMSPVMITIVQDSVSAPLTNIAFVGDNNRRIVLGVKVTQPITRGLYLNWTGNPLSGSTHDWRMVYINEGQLTMLKLPSSLSRSVRWIGGVMTNWTFKRHIADGVNASRLNFVSDASVPTDTAVGPTFASLLPRDAWLESYFFPVPPP